VLGTAVSWTILGPATIALCPALIALAKAPAIRTGPSARETAVFKSTLPNKLGYLCILTISTLIRLLKNACVGREIGP
jgi:hypothetical protein